MDQNLRRSFPAQPESWYARTRHRFYQQFADITVEAIYAWRMPRDELLQRMIIDGWEPLISAAGESPKPGILLSIHHNNWEWLLQRSSISVSSPFDGIYKPLHDRAQAFRPRSKGKHGANLVTLQTLTRYVLKSRRKARVIGLLADQSPSNSESKHWVNFLNQTTPFFTGPRLWRASQNTPCTLRGRNVYHGADTALNSNDLCRAWHDE